MRVGAGVGVFQRGRGCGRVCVGVSVGVGGWVQVWVVDGVCVACLVCVL